LIQGSVGYFYGIAYSGGTFGAGTLFRLIETSENIVTLALSSSTNLSLLRENVTFTASITGNNPTGTVEFLDGETRLGVVPVADGSATFSTLRLKIGSHSITAVYSGDASNPESTSESVVQVVKVATKTILKAHTQEFGSGVSDNFNSRGPGKKFDRVRGISRWYQQARLRLS
jgi:hypothetical protein